MSKEQINELLMGAAAVALAYALYKHFKPGAATAKVSTKSATAAGASAAAGGAAFAYGEPSPFTSMQNLLTGSVNDMGSWQGVDYLAQIESAPPVYGNGPRVAGGYW